MLGAAILQLLKDDYRSGLTYDEIAKKYRISHTYAHRLISGLRKADGMTLDTVSKMFPDAKLCLGDTVAHGSSNQVNGAGGTQTITNSSADGLVKAIRRVMHDAGMSDAQKVATTKIICGEEKD